jgi:hypothetical protein
VILAGSKGVAATEQVGPEASRWSRRPTAPSEPDCVILAGSNDVAATEQVGPGGGVTGANS